MFTFNKIASLSIFIFSIIFLFFFPNSIPSYTHFIFEENGLYEYLSFIFIIAASIITFKLFLKSKSLPYLLISLVCFGYGMEEISWGYFLFGDIFNYSPLISQFNSQAEPNLHNLNFGDLLDLRDLLLLVLNLVFIISLYKDNKYLKKKYSLYLLLITNSLCFYAFAFFFGAVIILYSNTFGPTLEMDWHSSISYWYSMVDEVQEYFLSLIIFFNFYEKSKKKNTQVESI